MPQHSVHHSMGASLGTVSLNSHIGDWAEDDTKISLFEMQSSVQATSSMMMRARVRCQRYQAHSFLMRRSTQGLKEIMNPSVKSDTKTHHVTNSTDHRGVAHTVSKRNANATSVESKQYAKGRTNNTDSQSKKPASKHTSHQGEKPFRTAVTNATNNPAAAIEVSLLVDKQTPATSTTTVKPDAKTTEHKSLQELLDAFVDSQSGSEDACHAQLLEARHQLNQLHSLVVDLVEQVNTTEASLIVYDKELQEKLQELMELEQWKDLGLKHCKKKKQEDKEMLQKLSVEMEEMIQIANPASSMNISGRTVSEQESYKAPKKDEKLALADATSEDDNTVSLLQANPRGSIMRAMMSLVHGNHQTAIPLLLQATHSAATQISQCASHFRGSEGSLIQESTDTTHTFRADPTSAPQDAEKKQRKAPTKEECEKQKEELEKTYVKAYVALSRLKSEYEVLVKSTACEDPINVEYEDRSGPLQKKCDKLSTQSMEAGEDLKELKPHLDKAQEAENKLRQQVKTLTDQCGQLGPTLSDLDKVRDAIEGLSLCPGLGRVEFKIPEWTGKWATFTLNSKMQDDKQVDKAMEWACNRQTEGSRPAEVGEIQERTILHMPQNNTAKEPLVGTCPQCAGKEDKMYKSGHARICWTPGKPLNVDSYSDNCAQGRKVIVCVLDKGDMREIPKR
eukprot:gnl/MRDRNA2_/MRDRNA2_91980_c0_seq1.p1 gnl/MRDRNA2_/MRDRNA2_91980_c0~~gnl/MRDRNA2_/MRDRNA2_91980_c0_seq1.p1  ORF type:complete len:764 (+),score=165.91 gnl/MRDRNA2_/MRDRNA2_91980_c0_seq1:260-2293(+)